MGDYSSKPSDEKFLNLSISGEQYFESGVFFSAKPLSKFWVCSIAWAEIGFVLMILLVLLGTLIYVFSMTMYDKCWACLLPAVNNIIFIKSTLFYTAVHFSIYSKPSITMVLIHFNM